MPKTYPMCPPGYQIIIGGAVSAADYQCGKCPEGHKLCAPTIYDSKCIPEEETCNATDSVMKGAAFWIVVAGIGAAAIYYFSREP